MSDYYTLFVTVPDEESAEKIARTVVSEKLAACVNIINPIRSIYHWQGEICTDSELLLIMKTATTRFTQLRDRILEMHSYDTPEIIALPIAQGHGDYLKWIDDSTAE